MNTATTTQPTQDQILTASLKLVIDAFVELGYEDTVIFGKVNLIINKFITPEGDFTPEYLALAKQAIADRESRLFRETMTQDADLPKEINIIMPGGIEL
jgi:hypothetical protein